MERDWEDVKSMAGMGVFTTDNLLLPTAFTSTPANRNVVLFPVMSTSDQDQNAVEKTPTSLPQIGDFFGDILDTIYGKNGIASQTEKGRKFNLPNISERR
jgi:hypothetical protein